jgi:hypothetical protein
MDAYTELANYLGDAGIGSYMQNPNLLVISSNYPALPSSNCFWAAMRDSAWYIGTWLPAVYQVPTDANVGAVCKQVYESSSRAIYTVDPELAARLHLRELDEPEMAHLGFT